MAGAERKSMLYLESRCVALARAIGAQGVQNGGIDGASVAAAVPSGLRELMSENLMAMMRNLESCSGNDALMSESDMRRTSRTLPIVLAGSDFMFSGFGSIQRYDNMFGPSNFNAEDIDDFLAMQRDWGVDGGLRTVTADRIAQLRREAAQMCRAVYQHLGLADFADDHLERAVDAAGSKDLGETDTLAVVSAAQAIRDGGITVVDVVAALDETGYEAAAERILAMTAQRLAGDYLQTSAIFDEQLRRAVAGHRPERLRRAGHRLRAGTRAPGRDRRDPPGPGGRGSARRAGHLGGPAARGGRAARPGTRPAGRPRPAGIHVRWSSGSPRRSAGTCGAACPG